MQVITIVISSIILYSCLLSASCATLVDLSYEKATLRAKLLQIFSLNEQKLQLLDNLIANTFADIVKKASDLPELVPRGAEPITNEPNSTVKSHCEVGKSCTLKTQCVQQATTGYCENADEVCCEPADLTYAEVVKLPFNCADDQCKSNTTTYGADMQTCGHRTHMNRPSRPVRKRNSGYAEFPWTVSVIDANQNYIAGGVLITSNKVLSVAQLANHTNVTQLSVRAGEWNRESNEELYPHIDRSVLQIVTHENYSGGNYKYNNIALIQLTMPFSDSPHIAPICLVNSLATLDLANCFVSAWGSRSAVLQTFPLATIASNDCDSKLRKAGVHWLGRIIRESLVCGAVQPDIESCGVDDGSPLVCPFSSSPNQYALVGLVNCGWRSAQLNRTQLPGIYSNVTNFAPWIQHKLNFLY